MIIIIFKIDIILFDLIDDDNRKIHELLFIIILQVRAQGWRDYHGLMLF